MDINELLDLLEIESPEEFSNFEDFANLTECDKVISYEAVFEVLSKASKDDLMEIINGYFDDITEQLPDDSVELFTLMGNVNNLLTGLLENEEEGNRTIFVDEYYRFKNYYTFGPPVICTNAKTLENHEISICEAIYNSRLEKLEHERYFYDFSACLDYEIEEYTVGFSATIDLEEDSRYDEEEDEERDYLIDKENPVIDGEFTDDDSVGTDDDDLQDYN